MNMIVESKGVAGVFAGGRVQVVDLEPEDLERMPEDTGIGYMEFFDWLAGTSHAELNTLYRDLCGLECVDLATNPHARERVGKAIWAMM